jgi:hypothetical protein
MGVDSNAGPFLHRIDSGVRTKIPLWSFAFGGSVSAALTGSLNLRRIDTSGQLVGGPVALASGATTGSALAYDGQAFVAAYASGGDVFASWVSTSGQIQSGSNQRLTLDATNQNPCIGRIGAGQVLVAYQHGAGLEARIVTRQPAVNASVCSVNTDCASNACVAGVCCATACPDDGDPCTAEQCSSDGASCVAPPVACTASDDCHGAGSCVAGVGCSNPPLADGTLCNGGLCQAGTCTATVLSPAVSAPVPTGVGPGLEAGSRDAQVVASGPNAMVIWSASGVSDSPPYVGSSATMRIGPNLQFIDPWPKFHGNPPVAGAGNANQWGLADPFTGAPDCVGGALLDAGSSFLPWKASGFHAEIMTPAIAGTARATRSSSASMASMASMPTISPRVDSGASSFRRTALRRRH